MQITLCKEPFEYIIIDNTYNEEELKLIFLELDYWSLSNHLLDPSQTGTARDNSGKILKNNVGIFLDSAYSDRRYSNILNLNRKLYNIEINEPSVIINFLKTSNHDSTLVSYYENGSNYESHMDATPITALTYLYKQPKAFEGGDLILTDYGLAFEPWFNRTYIIHGVINHEVSKIIMKPENCGKGLGRYTITNFIQKNTLKREQISNPL